jgi:hypothetical protein
MYSGNHAEMHREHQNWLCDNAMWRDEIIVWKGECQNALIEATPFRVALRRFMWALDEHEHALDRHAEQIAAHEHAVSEFEHLGRGDTVEMLCLAKTHEKEAAAHLEQRRRHEQLKKEREEIMLQWRHAAHALA